MSKRYHCRFNLFCIFPYLDFNPFQISVSFFQTDIFNLWKCGRDKLRIRVFYHNDDFWANVIKILSRTCFVQFKKFLWMNLSDYKVNGNFFKFRVTRNYHFWFERNHLILSASLYKILQRKKRRTKVRKIKWHLKTT